MADKTGRSGVDGTVELMVELDRLSAHSDVAKNAPRPGGLAGYLSRGIDAETTSATVDGPFWRLTVHLIQRLGIWWPLPGYSTLPVMTPWCIRDRSARYDQGPESWGAPRVDGYLRDDNSIIKKLPLPLTITATGDSPYNGRKPWRGFTACHIWRDLEDGGVGGADQWIYSNMSNLVWLPSPIMSLTDHQPRVQGLLKRASRSRFPDNANAATNWYADYAWGRLTSTAPNLGIEPELDLTTLAHFNVTDAFVRRRLNSIDLVVAGVGEILDRKPLSKKLICTRYSEGLPLLEKSALEGFRQELSGYASAVRSGLPD